MSRSTIRRLGLDHLIEAIAVEVRQTQLQVLIDERDRGRRAIDTLDARIAQLGGRRRPGRPRKATGQGRPTAAKSRHT